MSFLRSMDEKDGDSVMVRNRFQKRLTELIAHEYGHYNVKICDRGVVRFHHRMNPVSLWFEHDCATAICCLKTPSGDDIQIPKDRIAEYAPALARMPYARPSFYLSEDKGNYILHHSFIITESDLEYPNYAIKIIDNLCGLTDSSSEIWNQMIHETENEETAIITS